MRVRLHGPGGDFILVEGDNLLGRGGDCQLAVNDPRLSRHHARFVLHGAVVRVEDLGSRNGVLINGSRINAPTALTSGDVVVCGPCRFTCECDPHGAPAPRPSSAISKAHESTDTEPMDPVAGPPGARSRSRLIDQKIAAAVGTTRTGQPAARAEAPSVSIFKPDDAAEGGTSALADRPPSLAAIAQPAQHQTTGIVPHESHDSQDGALARRQAGPPSPGQRLGAAAIDGARNLGVLLVIALPLAAIGYVIALHAAGAIIVDGLPRVGNGPSTGAPWGALVASLVEYGALGRAVDLLPRFPHLVDRAPFLVLFATGTLIALAAVLLMLFTTVAATVLHGGPVWHRRLGLEVVMIGDGAFPSWSRSAWRWLLALLLWPLAPLTIALRCRSLHDVLSGCEVRRRPR